MVQLLADAGHIENAASITEMVLQQEGMMSTGIGGGIAVPHRMVRYRNGRSVRAPWQWLLRHRAP